MAYFLRIILIKPQFFQGTSQIIKRDLIKPYQQLSKKKWKRSLSC